MYLRRFPHNKFKPGDVVYRRRSFEYVGLRGIVINNRRRHPHVRGYLPVFILDGEAGRRGTIFGADPTTLTLLRDNSRVNKQPKQKQ